MDQAIATRLQTLNNIVCCIDNNQKGNTLKNQRYGKSVKYIKVTGCLIRKYDHCNYIDHETYKDSKANLTYSNQAIPSTFLMPHFDVIFSNEDYPSDRDLVRIINDISCIDHDNIRFKNMFKMKFLISQVQEWNPTQTYYI